MDNSGRLYANRIAKLLIEFGEVSEVIERIEKFFDSVCIDEVQDLASNDFNFLCALADADVDMYLVGDFYQHTFDTSRDGNIQKNLHKDFDGYCKKISDAGFSIDFESLSFSYRCSPSVCSFVSRELGVDIQSHREDEVNVGLVEDPERIEDIFSDSRIVKLFYKDSVAYEGYTDNWGRAKGINHFHDVCVVLNPTTFKSYMKGDLNNLAPNTKNKLYVACTRANGNLFFVEEKKIKMHRKK